MSAFPGPDGDRIARLTQRLALTRQTDPVKIERDLMKLAPREEWAMFSHWLIWHGRRRCNARKPDCPDCELREGHPSADRVMPRCAKPNRPVRAPGLPGRARPAL